MKKYCLSFAIVISLAALPLMGCKSVTAANGTTTSVPDVGLMQSVAKSAAYIGTTVYLNGVGTVKGHPDARPQFETARTSLQTLIAAGTFSAADLTAALQNLPVSELKGDSGTLIVGEAVILWDQYGRQLASLDKAQVFSTYVLPVAQALLDGLNMALGPAVGFSPVPGIPATPTAATPAK